jgi:predicted O-methyltransferase YrrM
MNDALRSLLGELEQFGRENDARARRREEKMRNITPETGELLAVLVRATRARRILEIGTSNGYSTLWLAEAAGAVAGSVVTVEVDPARADMARRTFERSGLSSWIRQEVGEAGELLSRQPAGQIDLLFLDADRGRYVAWWPSIQRVLAPGGLLLVDNAVSHAAEMADFLAGVRAAPGWCSVVIPVGKGELLATAPSRQERAGETSVPRLPGSLDLNR